MIAHLAATAVIGLGVFVMALLALILYALWPSSRPTRRPEPIYTCTCGWRATVVGLHRAGLLDPSLGRDQTHVRCGGCGGIAVKRAV